LRRFAERLSQCLDFAERISFRLGSRVAPCPSFKEQADAQLLKGSLPASRTMEVLSTTVREIRSFDTEVPLGVLVSIEWLREATLVRVAEQRRPVDLGRRRNQHILA
jgi:hypothetical protein